MILSGQLHVFHVARRSLLTKLNWDTVDERRLNLLAHVVREHTGVLLRAMMKARNAGRSAGVLHGKRPASRIRRRQPRAADEFRPTAELQWQARALVIPSHVGATHDSLGSRAIIQ